MNVTLFNNHTINFDAPLTSADINAIADSLYDEGGVGTLGGSDVVKFVFEVVGGELYARRTVRRTSELPYGIKVAVCGEFVGVIPSKTHDTIAFRFDDAEFVSMSPSREVFFKF